MIRAQGPGLVASTLAYGHQVRDAEKALNDLPVAFEDSRLGLRAARSAGARVSGLTTGRAPEELRAAGAQATIADFADPALWSCLDRLGTPVA